jgi:ADP-heptose:LPS heptosyltransferase
MQPARAGLRTETHFANLAGGLTVEQVETTTITALAVLLGFADRRGNSVSRRPQFKLAWIGAARRGTRVLLYLLRRALFMSMPRQPWETAIRRIVVYRIGNIGDILVTLPALNAIRKRFPGAHIALLTSPGKKGAPGAEQILPLGKWFDELLVYFSSDVQSWNGRLQLLRRLRKGKFDLFVQLPNQQSRLRDEVRNMMFARLAGCRCAVGFEVSQRALFLREEALHVPQIREALRIYRSVASQLLLDSYEDVLLPISDATRRQVASLLLAAGVPENEPIVVIHVGAKRQTNQWPLERYARVADEIIRRWEIRVVLTGSATELPAVESVAELMQEKPMVLCGQLDLPQTAALLERSSLYVGNDTGPMHIAAAVGTPTGGVFSARDFPERWWPCGHGHIVLRRDAPCSPCFKEICDRDLVCLKAIEEKDVLAAVGCQLSRQALPPVAQAEGI